MLPSDAPIPDVAEGDTVSYKGKTYKVDAIYSLDGVDSPLCSISRLSENGGLISVDGLGLVQVRKE